MDDEDGWYAEPEWVATCKKSWQNGPLWQLLVSNIKVNAR
jgi:hypothetical protein